MIFLFFLFFTAKQIIVEKNTIETILHNPDIKG